jgi:hypothetical protein
MKINRLLAIILVAVLVNSCVVLKETTVIKNDKIERYKYVFISPTSNLTSGTGILNGGNYGAYGSATSKSVNPGDVIKGILIKEGLISLPELKPELSDQTLIVNYGESGKRYAGLGYAIEVTIQFISAKSNTLICSCTAEGQGETEADEIREAITRCLSGVLSK